MDSFDNKEVATTMIKGWIDKGAFIFSHFTKDYDNFVIFRNDTTDQYIKELKKEKEDAEKKK
jgi:hypothetical protein